MTPLLSQIIRLTKSILLRPEDGSKRPSAQFIAGKRSPWGFSGGIALSWYSDDTFQALDAVVALTIGSSSSFRDCDPESTSDVVKTTLQEICVDHAIFEVDALFFSQRGTLFDCRTLPVQEFAAAINNAIEANLRASIGKRCTIHALPRLQSISFRFEEESVQVIAKNDREAWQSLIDGGYQFDGWTPERPILGLREDDRSFALPPHFECLFVAEEHGTQKGARFNSILRFRKLAAVLFAVASERAAHPYHKAMARPSEFCIQFSHESNPDSTVTRSDCAPIMPYFASDIPIGNDEVAATRDWYGRCSRCSEETHSRVEKGAHFLNRGMNSNDIEAYINYFVTLDALFGERGSVEASILSGVRALDIAPAYVDKASWLFDLRNEIVHGGSRYVTEWPKYTRYTQHFRSKPTADIKSLAQLAVLRAPYVFAP